MLDDRTPDQIAGTWIHAHEEDSSGRLVFRKHGTKLPPSRGRRALVLLPRGELRETRPGPDDRTVSISGTWTVRGCHLLIQPPNRRQEEYTIDELTPDRLVLKPA